MITACLCDYCLTLRMDECVTFSQTSIMTSPTLKPKNKIKNLLKMSLEVEPDAIIGNQELTVAVPTLIEDVDIVELDSMVTQYMNEKIMNDEKQILELATPIDIFPDPIKDFDKYEEFSPGKEYNTETADEICKHLNKASADDVLVFGPTQFCEVWCWHERSHLKKPSAFEYMKRKLGKNYSNQRRMVGVIYSDLLMKAKSTLNYTQETAKKTDNNSNSSKAQRKSSRIKEKAQSGHFVSFELDLQSGRCKVYDTILEPHRADFEKSGYFSFDAFEILMGLIRDCLNSIRNVTRTPLLKIETAQLSRRQGENQCGVLSLIYAEAMITQANEDVTSLTYDTDQVNVVRKYHQAAKKLIQWTPSIPFIVRNKRQLHSSGSRYAENITSSIHHAPKKQTIKRPKSKTSKNMPRIHLGDVSYIFLSKY